LTEEAIGAAFDGAGKYFKGLLWNGPKNAFLGLLTSGPVWDLWREIKDTRTAWNDPDGFMKGIENVQRKKNAAILSELKRLITTPEGIGETAFTVCSLIAGGEGLFGKGGGVVATETLAGDSATFVTKVEGLSIPAAENAGRQGLVDLLSQRARQLELGTDPARGFIQAEGTGGARLEQALGRTITRSADGAADFVDSHLGSISLKGPIPPQGSVQGLANAAIKDATMNTATRALVIDTKGLTPAQVAALKAAVRAGTAGTSKTIIFLH
jgi:hypothetical protein